jgi:hypothetical protein
MEEASCKVKMRRNYKCELIGLMVSNQLVWNLNSNNNVKKDSLKEKRLSCAKHGKRNQKWQEEETQQNGDG